MNDQIQYQLIRLYRYVPDDYTLNRTVGEFNTYGGGLAAYRDTYAKEIAAADLITINLGANNFREPL